MDADAERLEVGALSETGYAREENQDRMSGSRVRLGHLYIVADGMGGHKNGALAAQMAVEELQRHVGQAAADQPVDAVLQAAFKAANDAVYKRAHSGDSDSEGMGTTAVLLLLSGRVANVAHVGDSRAYLYRNNSLSQLTKDHTLVQRMVEAGMLRAHEAPDHPQASVLERAIGSSPTVAVDISSRELQDGDALLLCSDGLSGYVPDTAIEDVLRSNGPVQDTTTRLVQLALDTGGRDNVTVQLIRYGPRQAAPPPPPQTRPTRPFPPPAATSPAAPVGRYRSLIVKAVALALAGAATAAGGILYGRSTARTIDQSAASEITRLHNELDASKAATKQARDQVAELSRQRAAVAEPEKPTTGKAEKNGDAAKKGGDDVKEARQQVDANASVETLRKQLREAEAAKEKSEKRAADLERQLKEARARGATDSAASNAQDKGRPRAATADGKAPAEPVAPPKGDK